MQSLIFLTFLEVCKNGFNTVLHKRIQWQYIIKIRNRSRYAQRKVHAYIHGIEERSATWATYNVQFIVFFEFGPLNGAEGSILFFFFFPPIWFFFALASAAAALSALMFTLSSPVKFLLMIGFGLSSYLAFVACRASWSPAEPSLLPCAKKKWMLVHTKVSKALPIYKYTTMVP